MHHMGEALKARGQKYEKNLPEMFSKSTKMAIAVQIFKIFSG